MFHLWLQNVFIVAGYSGVSLILSNKRKEDTREGLKLCRTSDAHQLCCLYITVLPSCTFLKCFICVYTMKVLDEQFEGE